MTTSDRASKKEYPLQCIEAIFNASASHVINGRNIGHNLLANAISNHKSAPAPTQAEAAAQTATPTRTKASAKLAAPAETSRFQVEPLTSATPSTNLTNTISSAIDRDLGYLVNPRQVSTKAIATSTTVHRRVLGNNSTNTHSVHAIYGRDSNQNFISLINYQAPYGLQVQEMSRMHGGGIAVGYDNTSTFTMGQANVPRQTSFVGRAINGLVNLVPAAHAADNDFELSNSVVPKVNNNSYFVSFSAGLAGGSVTARVLFVASTAPVIGPVVTTAGAVGAMVMVGSMAETFERNNFMYTEEFDAVMQNPLISDGMKDKIWNDSFARQEAARLEASNAKSILTKIKENPFEAGFFVGSTFTSVGGKPAYDFCKQQYYKQSTKIFVNRTESSKYRALEMTKPVIFSAPQNRVQLEALKVQYRQRMDWKNPVEIRDPKLQSFVEKLYRKNAKIGAGGSTADAARREIVTGIQTEGSMHIDKTKHTITFLDKWLRNNQMASAHDRMIAENILLDCKDATGVKLWYSNTNVPH